MRKRHTRLSTSGKSAVSPRQSLGTASVGDRPLFTAEALETRTLLAAVSWTGAAGDGQWTTPGNWSTGALPGAADDVTINVAGNPTITLASGTQSIKSLNCSDVLSISGGTLNVATTAQTTTTLGLFGGTIGGTGILTIGGLFAWSAGTLSIAQTMANGGINFAGAGTDFLSTGSLTNPAGQTATIGAGGGMILRLQSGATFTNAGTFNADGNGSQVAYNGGAANFVNSGTLNVNAPGTTFTIGSNVSLASSGTVNVQSGTLVMQSLDGGLAGGFTLSAASTLQFDANYTLTATSSITGAGIVRFDSGTVTINGAYGVNDTNFTGGNVNFNTSVTNTGSMTFPGGIIGGTGALTIGGLFTWSGGTLSIAQTTASAGINFAGTATDFLSTGTLTNPAGQTATIGAAGGMLLRLQSGGTFDNLGTFTSLGNGSQVAYNGGLASFVNSGTLNVNAPGTTFTIGSNVSLASSGAINVQSGTLIMQSLDGGLTGTFTVSASSTLQFDANYTLTATSSITGAGVVRFDSGTVTINGVYGVNDTSLTGGNVNFNTAVTNSGPMTFPGGIIGGTGTLTIGGLFTWSGGTLSIAQTVANTGINLAGSATDFLSSGTLTNPAGQTATIGAGGGMLLRLQSGGTFDNLGTFTSFGNGSQVAYNGGAATFINSGTLNVNASGTTFTVGSNVTLASSGAINVQSGTLAMQSLDGGLTGSFAVAAASTLQFDANYTLTPTSAITGAGVVRFDSGTVTINGAYGVNDTSFTGGNVNFNTAVTNSGPLTFPAGIIGGTGTLTIGGLFTWSGGTLSIAQTMANGGTNFAGAGSDFLSTGTLTNPAGQTATLGAGGSFILRLQSGGTFNNLGTFTSFGNGSQVAYNGGAATFINSGTLNVNASGTTFTIGSNVTLVSSGAINVQSGTLVMQSLDGGLTGSLTVAATSTLQFDANYTLTSTSGIGGAGVVRFDAATVTLNGGFAVGGVEFTGGSVNFNTSVNVPAPVTLAGGTIGGSGSLTIGGVFTWSGSTLSIAQTIADGGISFAGDGIDVLSGGTLTNSSGQTATLGTGGGVLLRLQNGATFINAGTLNADGNGSQIGYNGGADSFINSGTLNVSASGSSLNLGTISTANSGTVNVQAGTLNLSGVDGGLTGSFTVAAGATLEFSASYTPTSTSSVTGPGTVEFVSGTVNVDGTYSVGTTIIQSPGMVNFLSAASTGILQVNGATLTIGGALTGAAPASGTATPATSTGSLQVLQQTAISGGGNVIVDAGLTFQDTAGLLFTGSGTVTIDSGPAPGQLLLGGSVIFATSTGSASIVSGGTGAVPGQIDLGGGLRSFTINKASTSVDMSVTAQVIDGSLQKDGSGLLQLKSANSYAGGTTLNSGTLEVDNAAALGSGMVTFAGGMLSVRTGSGAITNPISAAAANSITLDVGANALTASAPTLGSALNVIGTSGGSLTLNGPIALGNNLVIDNTVPLTINGAVSGSFGITKTDIGALTLAGSSSNTYTGTTTLNGTTLLLNKTGGAVAIPAGLSIVPFAGAGVASSALVRLMAGQQLASTSPLTFDSTNGTATLDLNGFNQSILSLSIQNAGGSAILGKGPTGAAAIATMTVGSLSIASGQALDVTGNNLQIQYASGSDPVASIRQYLSNGYAGGAWNGTGTGGGVGRIVSSTAAASGRTLGYADSADNVVTGLTANTILVKYTIPGDANLDGSVNFSDLVILAQQYGTAGAAWDQGGFGYAGVVNFADLVALAQNYNKTVGTAAMSAGSTALVPSADAAATASDSSLKSRNRLMRRARHATGH